MCRLKLFSCIYFWQAFKWGEIEYRDYSVVRLFLQLIYGAAILAKNHYRSISSKDIGHDIITGSGIHVLQFKQMSLRHLWRASWHSILLPRVETLVFLCLGKTLLLQESWQQQWNNRRQRVFKVGQFEIIIHQYQCKLL